MPGPIFLPPELPGAPVPSADDAPEALTYMRIYAGVMLLVNLALFVFGVFMLVQPQLAGAPAKLLDLENVVAGMVYMALGLAFGAPWIVLLVAGRRSWAHTMGSVLVAFSMLHMCCLPAAIPLLIAWNKPEVRRYFSS